MPNNMVGTPHRNETAVGQIFSGGAPTDQHNPTVSQESDRLSVLCVDDEESILRALKRQLHYKPYDVVTTTSPNEALDLLRSPNNIGLILTDYCMPSMTGAAFLEQAKMIRPEIPRMILSGHAETKVTLDAINLGEAFRFILKPWNAGELETAIDDGLHRYQLVKENQRLGLLTVKQSEEFQLLSSSLKQRVLQQTILIRKKLAEEKRHISLLEKTNRAIVDMLANILSSRNQRLYGHSVNVSAIALSMAIDLNLPAEQKETISMSGLLHDFGKICLSDRLLAKNVSLFTAEEMKEYRNHINICMSILSHHEGLQDISNTIFTANNYILNKSGTTETDDINVTISSKIVALADWTEKALARETGYNHLSKRLQSEIGHIFDSEIIAAAANAIIKKVTTPNFILASPSTKVAADKLTEGMVLSINIYGSNGLILAGKGMQINSKMIELIQNYIGKSKLKTTGVNIFIKSIPEDINLSEIEPIPLDLLLPTKS